MLEIPDLPMRESMERPCTVSHGSSTLVGNDAAVLLGQIDAVLAGTYDVGSCPELWDGHAAETIVPLL